MIIMIIHTINYRPHLTTYLSIIIKIRKPTRLGDLTLYTSKEATLILQANNHITHSRLCGIKGMAPSLILLHVTKSKVT